MSSLLSSEFLTALVSGAVLAGVPLLFAALGETISEQGGVLNIGLEGMMLSGAYGGFVVAHWTGSSAAGFLAALVAGALVALLVVVFCVRMGRDQIVVGIAVLLSVEGLTSLLHAAQFGTSYPRLGAAPAVRLPWLTDLPVVGPGLFGQPVVVYLGVALVFVTAWALTRTNAGLALRAAGWRPAALDNAGVDVLAVRTVAVLVTGALAGLGGGFMAIVAAGVFVPFMTGGMGFIAIVIAMLGRGRPLWVAGGALLFGLAMSATTSLQLAGVTVPTDVVQMLPFVTVILALIVFARRSYLPSALAVPYVRGRG